ncbi:MAG: alpha/beta hydrolase-fold protein [Planctomycetota bacterium]
MIKCCIAIGLGCLALGASAQPVFWVTHDQDGFPISGRLIFYFVDETSEIDAPPSAAPFFRDPQPMTGADVERWGAGDAFLIDSFEHTFPVDGIPPGSYRVQAVLDRNRLSGDWSREPGNLFSGITRVSFAAGESPEVMIRLDQVVGNEIPRPYGRVEFRRIESRLLTDARLASGDRVFVDVGVIPPIDAEPGKRYPVVYQVPGFGGTHEGAVRRAFELSAAPADSPMGRLARSAYWVVLNPDGPNGHHKFVDSRANGPVGQALVEEIVPAIDSFYPTIAEPGARLLRGHSSGGWSVIHLALTYPETFGGAWSSAPDPLDFRAFQAVNIYDDANMYTDGEGDPWPSYTDGSGVVRMTIADENAMESVMGPGNTSGQQWDSWQAAFGSVDDLGNPAPLYDEQTGAIDKQMAERFRRNDLAGRVRRDRAEVGRLTRDRVRVIVGDADEYDLDEGVRLFVESVEGFGFGPQEDGGWYAIVPGATHGSVLRSEAARNLLADLADAADAQLQQR